MSLLLVHILVCLSDAMRLLDCDLEVGQLGWALECRRKVPSVG
jgi:hypothetical protein